LERRDFIKAILGSAAALAVWQPETGLMASEDIIVNDLHSQLNPTHVDGLLYPSSIEDIKKAILKSAETGESISITGARHSMGAQQFGTHTNLLDITTMNDILEFDPDQKILEVESGARWAQIVGYLVGLQKDKKQQLGIRQKQSADLLTIGGSVSANMHGDGLFIPPFAADIESMVVVNSGGRKVECSREKNEELFRLVTGGLGLFGIIYSVRLRLVPRQKIRKSVSITDTDKLIDEYRKKHKNGALYGSFQYYTNINSEDYLRKGVLITYEPVETEQQVPDFKDPVPADKWLHLRYLAHADKEKYFKEISDLNKATDNKLYWTDTHQLGTYIYNYHKQLDKMLHREEATDVTTEVYVPSDKLGEFLNATRNYFRKNSIEVIFGGIGMIAENKESYLSYTRRTYSRISFNIHTPHTSKGIDRSADAFRFLIDQAIKFDGSYYLANHKFATPDQFKKSFPDAANFMELKKKYDPHNRFLSDWYRYYKKGFTES